MRPSNTGKSDPQHQPAPAKRGFFAAAGERLKRAMSGGRAAPAAAPSAAALEGAEGADGEGEATTSVQAKARELLLQDRTHRRGSAPAAASEDLNVTRQRRTSPPPLPSQRTAADAISGSDAPAERLSSARPKRPVRDSKSEALRARLGAAKAALAEAQAKRAAELPPAPSETTPELAPPAAADEPANEAAQPTAADAKADGNQLAAGVSADDDGDAEPIRTLTIARLLARQGYYDRSLSIYDELLTENTEDLELRAEADKVRAQQSGTQPRS